MKDEYEKAGYVKGAIVRQYHNGTLHDDAIITYVHNNGSLDVEINGRRYGWSVKTCTPLANIKHSTE